MVHENDGDIFCWPREGANLPKCYSKKQKKSNGVVDGQESLVQKKKLMTKRMDIEIRI